MSIRKQLCGVVISIKSDEGLTYDEMLEKCNGGNVRLSRSQLSNILCNGGKNVAIELIERIIDKLGGEVSIGFTRKDDYPFY